MTMMMMTMIMANEIHTSLTPFGVTTTTTIGVVDDDYYRQINKINNYGQNSDNKISDNHDLICDNHFDWQEYFVKDDHHHHQNDFSMKMSNDILLESHFSNNSVNILMMMMSLLIFNLRRYQYQQQQQQFETKQTN